jgi:DNA-binding MurR/RpiR family transcriptional regulator
MSTDASGVDGATLLAARIARALPRLRPSEVRVVKTMLELGTALETMTSTQVAAKAAVHASTVVRTCHLLGFQSFGEARAAVRQRPGG